MKKWALFLMALLVFISACTSTTPQPAATVTPTAVPATPSDRIYVDAGRVEGSLNPALYGSNYGPWLFVAMEVRPQAEAAGIRLLRFPGGRWGDENDIDPWQLDQFMQLARAMGSEPLIHVRLLKGTPEKAAALVKYANIEKGYKIRYWSVGNEANLYVNQFKVDYDTERFNREWREIAKAMEAVDPTILLVGPDTSQFMVNEASNPKDKNGVDWLRSFLKANGDMVDVVAVHRYPFPNNPEKTSPTYQELLANGPDWDAWGPALRKVIKEETGRDLPIALTEVNSNWAGQSGGEATPETFVNGLWWGDVLTRLVRQRVDMVAQFCLVTRPGTGEWGLLARDDVRPIYYVYLMYKQFGSELVFSNSPDALVTVAAALRQDGALTVMLVNRGDAALSLPLRVDGFGDSRDGSRESEYWLFDADHKAEKQDNMTVPSDGPISLPPASMNLLVFYPAK